MDHQRQSKQYHTNEPFENNNNKNDDSKPAELTVSNKFASLQRACKHGDINTVRNLVEKGIMYDDKDKMPNKKSSMKYTPLILASQRGHLDIVRYLIEEAGVDANQTTTKGINAVTAASSTGKLEVVRYLVEKCKVSIEPSFSNGLSRAIPLLKASQRGHISVMKYFIENCRLDVNTCDQHHRTCLHFAVAGGMIDGVRYLVEHGADVNTLDVFGISLLDIGCSASSLEIIKILFENGVKVNPTKSQDLLEKALRHNRISLFEYLVNEQGIDIDTPSKSGHTLLHYWCCGSGDDRLGALSLLLKMGANVEAKTKEDDLTPLHKACKHADATTTELLCKYGADVNARAKNGQTPLISALNHQNEAVALYLLKNQRGVDANARDAFGMVPLHYACNYALLDVVKYLVEIESVNINTTITRNYSEEELCQQFPPWDIPHHHKPGTTPLHSACYSLRFEKSCENENRLDTVKYLISKGAELKALDEGERNPLHCAFQSKNLDIVELLLDAYNGHESLHTGNWDEEFFRQKYYYEDKPQDVINYVTLALKRCPTIIHVLPLSLLTLIVVEDKLDPTLLERVTSTKTGNLPIHDACKYGSKEGVIDFMIEHYPDAMDQPNALGRLPFHEACTSRSMDSFETVQKLCYKNPSFLSKRDASGNLPFKIAVENDASLSIIYYLLRELPNSLLEIDDSKYM